MTRLAWVIDRPLQRGGLVMAVAPGVLIPSLIGLGAFLLAAIGGPEQILVSLGIACILAVAYQVFVGSTGIISFGHMAFVAVGAYVAGLVTVPPSQRSVLLPDLPEPLNQIYLTFPGSLLLAAAVCAVLAVLSGLVLMRMNGIAAGIATLGLLVIVNEVIRNSGSITRGTQTFFGVPAATNLLSTGVIVLLVTLVALTFKFSKIGTLARAARDDDLAYQTLGGSVFRGRMWAWVISGALTGVGGALLAQQLTAFSPSSFFIADAVPIIVIVVLGGINSVAGSLVGAVFYVAWTQFMLVVESGNILGLNLPVVAGIGQLTIGVGLILVLRWRPYGLLNSSEVGLVTHTKTSLQADPVQTNSADRNP